MCVIIGSADPGFEPIILSVDDNNYLIKEYYDKDDKSLPESLYCYARFVKGRWPEAESIIMKSPYYAFHYARYVIKGRWPEAESNIKQNKKWWDEYCRFFGV